MEGKSGRRTRQSGAQQGARRDRHPAEVLQRTATVNRKPKEVGKHALKLSQFRNGPI